MKFIVITVTDGNFLIRSEWSDLEGAIKEYHGLARILWSDTGFTEGYIAIMDSNLDIVGSSEGKYKEFITHTPQPVRPEPEPEPTEE